MVKLTSPTTLIPLLAAGLLFGLFIRRSYQVGLGPASQEVATSIGTFGQSLGAVGGGIQELGTGVGTGISKLFNPLFTLRDLIFPPEAGNQPAPTAATQGQTPLETPVTATPTNPPPEVTPPPVSTTPTSAPIPLTTSEAQRAITAGVIKVQPWTQKLIQPTYAKTLRGAPLQLYVNRRNELVRVTQASATRLVKSGYLRKI